MRISAAEALIEADAAPIFLSRDGPSKTIQGAGATARTEGGFRQ